MLTMSFLIMARLRLAGSGALLCAMLLISSLSGAIAHNNDKGNIRVFYKEQPPSLETLAEVKSMLDAYENNWQISYLQMTESKTAALMQELGLPTEHSPFSIAINGKTSARIGDETIVFVNFPDFMLHIGRHKGNWSLKHLEQVLRKPDLLLPDNPRTENRPGGRQ